MRYELYDALFMMSEMSRDGVPEDVVLQTIQARFNLSEQDRQEMHAVLVAMRSTVINDHLR